MLSRNSHRAFVFLALPTALFLPTFIDAASQRALRGTALEERSCLPNLCMLIEARYTRKSFQTDLHSALQDHPISNEHLQSSALLMPLRELSVFIKKSGVSYLVLLDRKLAIARQYRAAWVTICSVGADIAVFGKSAGELL